MSKFNVGDKVYFHGRPAIVKQVIREPDADYILDVQGDEFYAEGVEVTSRNSRACNAGKAMISRRGNDWYYAWADGAKDGREGPFKTEEEAIIAAKQDGFKIVNSRACNSRNPIVANAMNACGAARNADAVASQKLRNEWHNAFQSMKRLYDVAKSEGHKAIMDAANAATKVLMDKTQSFGFS